MLPYSEYLSWLENILLDMLVASHNNAATINWQEHSHTTVLGFAMCKERFHTRLIHEFGPDPSHPRPTKHILISNHQDQD